MSESNGMEVSPGVSLPSVHGHWRLGLNSLGFLEAQEWQDPEFCPSMLSHHGFRVEENSFQLFAPDILPLLKSCKGS